MFNPKCVFLINTIKSDVLFNIMTYLKYTNRFLEALDNIFLIYMNFLAVLCKKL